MKNEIMNALRSLPRDQRNQIEAEACQAAIEKTADAERLALEGYVRQLQEISGLGRISALAILAAVGNVLDEEDWPKDCGNAVSAKTMKKARSLSVDKLNSTRWYVAGGSEPHIVEKSPEFECDCKSFQYRNICSHIIAVKLKEVRENEEADNT